MTALANTEYERLGLESSDLMMERDGRRSQGRYPEAAYASMRAGELRLRMGEIALAEGMSEWAAEDWLSAAGCFLAASDTERARDALGKVRHLETGGKIPAARGDLIEALAVREREL